jgi:hypothetical protein
MSHQHRDLAEGRWDTLSLVEQLGNIGSEVERILRWREKGNEDYAMRAMDRALELFALTLACPNNKGRLREISRAREALLDFIVGDNEFASTGESLRRYFLPFAVAARAAHEARVMEK